MNHSLSEAGLKCIFRLRKRVFPIIVSFFYIYILQGNVVTHLRRGKIFNSRVIANCPQAVPVK